MGRVGVWRCGILGFSETIAGFIFCASSNRGVFGSQWMDGGSTGQPDAYLGLFFFILLA